MILGQDKYSLRNTLSTMNDRLYKRIDHAMRVRHGKRTSLQKKRVKFAAANKPQGGDKRSIKLKSTPESQARVVRKRASSVFMDKRKDFKSNIGPRKSIVSAYIDDLRETQTKLRERAEKRQSTQEVHKAA